MPPADAYLADVAQGAPVSGGSQRRAATGQMLALGLGLLTDVGSDKVPLCALLLRETRRPA